MNVLGLSFMYHDSAACLLRDGLVVGAVAEERFSRKKHSLDFPEQAVACVLRMGGLEVGDLDAVVFYEKPLLKFERIMTMSTVAFPQGFSVFAESMPLWARFKLHIPSIIRSQLGYTGELFFADHHYAHASSTFYASGFDEAAVLTMDGVGEWATMCRGHGAGHRLHLTDELRYPHSVGLLYSAVTAFLGFRVNSGEGKVMGLASYGEPSFYDVFMDEILDLKDDGSFRMNLDWFSFFSRLVMYSDRFEAAFGPAREPESALTRRDFDLAASLQKATETIVLTAARHLQAETGHTKLCVAGGVGLNSVANGRILRETPFEEIFVQPASGDDGGSIGAALYYYHQIKEQPRRWRMEHAYLGPSYSSDEIEAYLQRRGLPYRRYDDPDQLLERVATDLADGLFVGWMHGPMEFGPRALGARSILANPARPGAKDELNARVKFRESFRPFAPAVPIEQVGEWFEPDAPSPYMLLVGHTREDKKALIPEVTHVDGTARIQTVERRHNPRYYDLIRRLGDKTGVPVVLNTSFNIRGEPIVCDHVDALTCFLNTGLDRLVLEDCYLAKDPAGVGEAPWPLVDPGALDEGGRPSPPGDDA